MLIAEARFVKNAQEKLVSIREVSKQLYDYEFRGFLYCPTPGCQAKLLYVNSESAHFRTWKYYSHHEGCEFHFERRWVDLDLTFGDVTVGFEYERRQRALSEAYQEMRFPDEIQTRKGVKRTAVSVQHPTLPRRKRITGIQTTLFDDETWQGMKLKRPPLRKKYVSKINVNDIGKHKLVMGYVQNIELIGDVARITLLESDKEIDIVFEEAFTEEGKNSRYLNKFGNIWHYAEQNEDTAFAGIGEVRFNRTTDRFELQVFFGSDFRIENMDLLTLSAKMALGGVST